MNRIIIIGGGAAGIAAAISAAQTNPAAHITILEGLDRVGKKILATGNGRCNLTNEYITPEHYHSQQPERLRELLTQMCTTRTLDFFQSLGLYCTSEDMGRIYPYCKQASMVLDILLLALKRYHIHVVCSCKVIDISISKKAFILKAENGQEYRGDTVILTAGGRAAPKQGTSGTSYPLAVKMGHRYARLYPCLVPLQCKSSVLKGLKGIRVTCQSILYHGKQKLTEELGEIQLTEYGLSGIPALQFSCWLDIPAKETDYTISLDLFPDWSYDDLRSLIQQRIRAYPEETLDNFLLGLINKKILYGVFKTLCIEPLSRTTSSLSKREIDHLVSTLKGWKFPVTGTLSWDHAQVTGGGIFLDEIDDTFASRKQKGLYLAGEMLDAAGDCGGYNLHWAWCSGMAAGKAAAEFVAPH
ncbi:MAG: aminoacetone oxidase family FAD-binding enzyme [Clostridia bacterium]|nr:aminoacetone oxidase family FAD-binding enzyme [Clostridia bacterium]